MLNERYIIIGNSGSGKSWTGKALSKKLKIPVFHMDQIWWESRHYNKVRSLKDIEHDIENICLQKEWILEGFSGVIAQKALPFTSHLIWLDLEWKECHQNLIKRGPQLGGSFTENEKRSALEKLIEWASTHYSRQDKNSQYFFQELFTSFTHYKICLQNRNQILDYINSHL